jgi:hypothetical protein
MVSGSLTHSALALKGFGPVRVLPRLLQKYALRVLTSGWGQQGGRGWLQSPLRA